MHVCLSDGTRRERPGAAPISTSGEFDQLRRGHGIRTPMPIDTQVVYLEYTITITEEGGRFTARVSREGGLIEHDGRASEVWATAGCGSLNRAVLVAKTAVDGDRIR